MVEKTVNSKTTTIRRYKMKKVVRMMSAMLVIVLSVTVLSGTRVEAAKQYTFKYKKVVAKMNGKAKSFKKKAGKIQKYNVSKSCAYDGYDRTYLYKNFMLVTYSKSTTGPEYISCIKLRTSKVSTREGIKIGSKESDVIKAYGKAKPKYGVYTYKKGKSKLQIEVSGGVVKAITYIAR